MEQNIKNLNQKLVVGTWKYVKCTFCWNRDYIKKQQSYKYEKNVTAYY